MKALTSPTLGGTVTASYQSSLLWYGELCGRLGDEARSDGVVSRHFDDLDSVLEFAVWFSFQKNG